jgi:hypothetical protein
MTRGWFFPNGIYFLSGGCELSGTYRGSALIVVDGDVTLGSLTKSGDSDCIAVLCTELSVLSGLRADRRPDFFQ